MFFNLSHRVEWDVRIFSVFHILVIIYTLPLRAVRTVQAGECVFFTLLCSSVHGVSDIVNGFPKMCEGEEDRGRAIETFL